MSRTIPLALVVLAVAACVRPADQRASLDLEVGRASVGGVDFAIADGLANVIDARDGALTLWAQAPGFSIAADVGGGGTTQWIVEVQNCLPEAEADVAGEGSPSPTATRLSSPRPAVCRFEIDLAGAPSATIDIGAPDADIVERYQFAVMGDIQTGMVRVEDVFEKINSDPEIRFVMSTGDVVQNGEEEEYEEFLDKVQVLDVPFYSTIGNHELAGEGELWHEHFGLYNVHFSFKGVAFSFLDSGNASLDPIVYDRLEQWLDEAADGLHVFGTHYPAFDPIGLRSASFRSRREANKLLGRLAAGGVDLTCYGHIHSYYAYENAGIPAFISGGGGAIPERFDGVGRHFLKVDADPARGTMETALIRVD